MEKILPGRNAVTTAARDLKGGSLVIFSNSV